MISPKSPNDLLELALRLEIEERMDVFPSDEDIPKPVFSKSFKKKMKALIKSQKRPKVIRILFVAAKRTAVVLLTVALMAMTTVLSVEALRNQLFSFVAEVFETYTAIHFQRISPSADGRYTDPEFTVSVPTYIPKDFTLVDSSFLETVRLEYEDGLGGNISYDQDYLSGVGMDLNTEGVKLIKIEMNGCPGFYYSNLGMQSILWYDDYYLYSVSTTLPKYEAEKIAKSVK